MQLTQGEEFDHWPKDGHISKYFAIHIRLSLRKIMIKFPLNQSPSYKEYWTSSQRAIDLQKMQFQRNKTQCSFNVLRRNIDWYFGRVMQIVVIMPITCKNWLQLIMTDDTLMDENKTCCGQKFDLLKNAYKFLVRGNVCISSENKVPLGSLFQVLQYIMNKVPCVVNSYDITIAYSGRAHQNSLGLNSKTINWTFAKNMIHVCQSLCRLVPVLTISPRSPKPAK